MFTRKILVMTGIILVATAGSALAGAAVFAGMTLPMGDLNDVADTGSHFGARMHVPIVPLVFSAGPQAAYHSLPGSASDDDMTFIEFLATARFSLPAGPVLIGGLGWTVTDGTIQGIELDKETEFTWTIGTGASFMVLDLSAMWHHLGERDFITVSAGLGF